jgi:exonuclease III
MHKRLHVDGNDVAFSTQSAIDLLLIKYKLTRAGVGIPEMTLPTKQASIKSFFCSSNENTSQQQHNEQGRFQFFLLDDIDIIHTYVPNHGTKPESYARRKEWDDAMLQFVTNRLLILQKAKATYRQLLWAGDMNVAHDYRDGTHWSNTNGMIQEWWTDERKCFSRPGDPNRAACHRGMPSFTPAERTRFEAILKQGQLTDIWRELHPDGSTTHLHLSTWERPDWTWRGHPGKNKKGKYEGTGQRLDYFLTSNIAMDSVEECEILGYGSNREGLFCGSDHCAVKLQLRK